MINSSADNYNRISANNQDTRNQLLVSTGNIRDFRFQEKRPAQDIAFAVNVTANRVQGITKKNQDTRNTLVKPPMPMGPIGMDAGLHPVTPQYNAEGKVYYPTN